jgi:phosphate:Na+ symporter
MKAAGALLVLLSIPLLPAGYQAVFPDGLHTVAWLHTLFNLFIAALFFPLSGRVARLREGGFAWRPGFAPGGNTVFIDPERMPVAGAALGQVAREILRMADMVQEMLDSAVEVICKGNTDRIARIGQLDEDLEKITQEIKIFLSSLGQTSLDAVQTQRSTEYIGIVTDLKNIGDFVDRTMDEHFNRLAEKISFSEEGGRELLDYLENVGTLYRDAISAFVTRDPGAAHSVVERRRAIGNLERKLRISHIQRVQSARPDSLETSEAHMDILAAWKGISAHCASIARTVTNIRD